MTTTRIIAALSAGLIALSASAIGQVPVEKGKQEKKVQDKQNPAPGKTEAQEKPAEEAKKMTPEERLKKAEMTRDAKIHKAEAEAEEEFRAAKAEAEKAGKPELLEQRKAEIQTKTMAKKADAKKDFEETKQKLADAKVRAGKVDVLAAERDTLYADLEKETEAALAKAFQDAAKSGGHTKYESMKKEIEAQRTAKRAEIQSAFKAKVEALAPKKKE